MLCVYSALSGEGICEQRKFAVGDQVPAFISNVSVNVTFYELTLL